MSLISAPPPPNGLAAAVRTSCTTDNDDQILKTPVNTAKSAMFEQRLVYKTPRSSHVAKLIQQVLCIYNMVYETIILNFVIHIPSYLPALGP